MHRRPDAALAVRVVPVPEFFVDTSAWFPLLLRKHPQHASLEAALRSRIGRGERLVTTNLVLAETHALLTCRGHRAAAVAFLRTVREAPNLVVPSTREREDRALADWLERFDDQDFSLTDAVSFVVMRERKIKQALTLDRHFAVAGFEAVGT